MPGSYLWRFCSLMSGMLSCPQVDYFQDKLQCLYACVSEMRWRPNLGENAEECKNVLGKE